MLNRCQRLVAEVRAGIKEMGWDEVEAAAGDGCLLIDVREPHEFAAGKPAADTHAEAVWRRIVAVARPARH